MKKLTNALFVAALIAITGVGAHATTKSPARSILVESPSQLPELAQDGALAMHLHNTNDGRSFLYLERNDGRKLAIFDVTDPAKIRMVAQVAIEAASPFDFVQDLGDSASLIRYRDHSGFAIVNFKHWRRPVLVVAPQVMSMGDTEALGSTGLLLTSAPVKIDLATQMHSYQVLDTSNPAWPSVVATVPGVTQRLLKADTGTIFLLNKHGVTVIRNLAEEETHQEDLYLQAGN